MVRELAAPLAASLVWLPALGCSLVLDFSDSAIPRDAAPDAPYTQAECSYGEPNDTFATAAMVGASDTGPAAICAGAVEDDDFYKLTVPASTAMVQIAMSSIYRPGGDLDLRLYDPTGAPITESVSFGNQELIVCPGMSPTQTRPCPALIPGMSYVFEVYPVDGSVNAYTFALTFTP